jgi:hypothetical protein
MVSQKDLEVVIPNSRVYPGICLEGIKEITKTFSRIVGVPHKN